MAFAEIISGDYCSELARATWGQKVCVCVYVLTLCAVFLGIYFFFLLFFLVYIGLLQVMLFICGMVLLWPYRQENILC